jgi:long-chain acyl-CoA synthetase
VFPRYHNLPEATSAAFTPDGWFRTGDFGAFDADGYLRFLGRKKELLKLSTAKFVRPMPIEERLKESPLIEDAVVIGDDRRFAAAVLQPIYESLVRKLREAGVSVPEPALEWRTNILGERVIDGVAAEVLAGPEARRVIQAEVDRVNEDLDPHERVMGFVLAPRRFTIGGEELTPTLKVRRDAVLRKYAREIEALYAEPPPTRP